MEKLKKIARIAVLVFMMFLASVGMSISGAAPPIPRHKETVMEDEIKTKQEEDNDEIGTLPSDQKEKQ